MTLAVAAIPPWGKWESALRASAEQLGADIGHGLVLAADSRWTWSSGRWQDGGAKLFQIASDAGGVYAGDVEAGEWCLQELAQQVNCARTRHDRKRRPAWASRLFKRIYHNFRQRRSDIGPLEILIGTCSPQGIPWIVSFSSSKDFLPEYKLPGITLIGSPTGGEAFQRTLAGQNAVKEAILSSRGSSPQEGLDIWAVLLVSALHESVIKPAVDSTVGGLISCAVIDRNGFREMTIAGAAWAGPGNMQWRRVTPIRDDLRYLTRRYPYRTYTHLQKQ